MKSKIAFLFCLIFLLFVVNSCSEEKDNESLTKPPLKNIQETVPKIDTPQDNSNLNDINKAANQNSYKITVEEPDTYVYDGNSPVYVIIDTHNENSWGVYVDKFSDYKKYRANLLEKLTIIDSYNAKLNWQSDYPVLDAMIKYEENAELLEQTNGKNILQYMLDLGFSVDPHLHPDPYTYADIAYLIEELDVSSSSVIGGVQVLTCENGKAITDDWRETLKLEDDGYVLGNVYPLTKWKPTILSGGAMRGHWADDMTSGIWRPGSGTLFYENDPSGQIIYVGQGDPHDQTNLGLHHDGGALVFQKDGQYIKELIEMIVSGRIPSGKMYTAMIHVRDTEYLPQEGVDVNEGLKKILEELKPYYENGQIVYVTFQEAVDIWKEEYNEEPVQLGFEAFSEYNEYTKQVKEYCQRSARLS